MGKRPGTRLNAQNRPLEALPVDWEIFRPIPPVTAVSHPSESEPIMTTPTSETVALGHARTDSDPRADTRRSSSVVMSDKAPSCSVDFQPEKLASMASWSGMLEQWHDTQMGHSDSSDPVLGFDDELQSSHESLHHVTAAFGAGALPIAPGLQISHDLPIAPGPGRSQDRRHDCTSLVLASLQSLHFFSTFSCVSKPVSTVPTIDQVLTINKTAIQHVYRLLACSCSRDPLIPLLVAAVCAKIFAWYQAIARVDGGNSGSGTTAAVTTTSLRAETVIHTPVTLGAYELDGADEESMRTQLVLSELRKADRLVDKFTERFGWDAEAGPDQAGDVDRGLGVFLRTRLQEIARETMEDFKRRMRRPRDA